MALGRGSRPRPITSLRTYEYQLPATHLWRHVGNGQGDRAGVGGPPWSSNSCTSAPRVPLASDPHRLDFVKRCGVQ